MTSKTIDQPDRTIDRLRIRRDLLDLELRRALTKYRDEGLSERRIAAVAKMAQPIVHDMLKAAERDPELIDGFKGATPLEICERYDAGEFGRDDLIDQLVRYPYAKMGKTDGVDWLAVDPPGTWAEVSAAQRRGLIDMSIYEEVLDRRHDS